MSYYRVKPEALAILTSEDKKVLHGIYKHRCLNEEQLAKYFYQDLDDGKNDYTLYRIRALRDAGFIDIEEYGEDQRCVFYLTHMGVQFVRDTSEVSLKRPNPGSGPRYEINCSALRVGENLLNHQTELNTLSLEIERRCGLDPQCYKDSVYASNFSYAQPDGVFELPEFDIFLEMDMGNERRPALLWKWSHYRTYLGSRDYYLRRGKKIIVLFATQRVKKLEFRRKSVVKSISEMIFDLVGPNLDFYIGNSEEMIGVAERLINGAPDWFQRVGSFFQKNMGAAFSKPSVITEACREPYLYMKLPGEDGRAFLFEDYSNRQMLGLKHAVTYASTQSLLAAKVGQVIPLLVLAPSEDAIFRDLCSVDALAVPNVYYVTPARLRERPLCEALFQFDKLGNRFHFTDLSLTEQVHEKRQRK